MPYLSNRAFSVRWGAAQVGENGGSFDWGLEALLNELEARAWTR